MAVGLSEFISHIKSTGIFRPSRYEIVFDIPKKLAANVDATTMSITCMTANLPGYDLVTEEVRNGNFPREIAVDRKTEALTTDFLVTGNFDQKQFFDNWIALIFKDQHRVEYYANYISSMVIRCYDVADNMIYSCEYTEVYPKVITQISLNREESNSTSMFQVTWAYHRILPGVDSPASNDTYDTYPVVNDSGTSYGLTNLDLLSSSTGDYSFSGLGDGYAASIGFADVSIPGVTVTDPVTGITNTVSDINGSIGTYTQAAKDSVAGVANTVNGVIGDIKQGVQTVTDGLNQVGKVISDFKRAVNTPGDLIKTTVNKINSAIGGVTKQIPGLNKKNYKIPSINIPRL